MPVELADALSNSMQNADNVANSEVEENIPQKATKQEKKNRRVSITYTPSDLEYSSSSKTSSKQKKEKEKDKSDSDSIKFLVLIRREEDEFPEKCKVKASTIQELKEKLTDLYEIANDESLVFFDKEFEEYIHLPRKIEDIPTKLKLLIVKAN